MTSPDTYSALPVAQPSPDVPAQRQRSLGQTFHTRSHASRRFYSVAEVAEMSGISSVTLYRAINAGEFPAVKVRGRVIVPAKVLDALIDGAVETGAVVDAASYVVTRRGGGQS